MGDSPNLESLPEKNHSWFMSEDLYVVTTVGGGWETWGYF